MVVMVPALRAIIVSDRDDKVALFIMMILFGSTALISLWFVNEEFPFSGAGDDKDYFDASVRPLNGIDEWLNLRQFKGTHEQGGYPLLLSWIHQFSGGSLFHRKAMNLGFFLLLAPVWYEIGRVIGGRRLAFVFATGVLLCTPLWFYWVFLLKDIVIVFLQSLLLLGLVNVLSGTRSARGYCIVVLSTVLLIPFRSLLTLLNGAALVAASFLRGRDQKIASVPAKLLIACVLVGALIVVGRNATTLEIFGVAGENRTLSYNSVKEQIALGSEVQEVYLSNPIKFTLVYLVGEVAAFNPQSWRSLNAELIRSVTMVPWVYFGLPFFLIGAWSIAFNRKAWFKNGKLRNVRDWKPKMDGSELPDRACLMLLLGFVAGYALVSWLSGDTTRWRMPSMPPMIAVAGFAWCSMRGTTRFHLLVGWFMALSVALVVYYGVVKY
jgi:hypothetical protein